MKETMQIEIPKDILQKAKERGVDIVKFKDTVRTFALLDITARASKLSKGDATLLSKKIKSSAWKKIKKNLDL